MRGVDPEIADEIAVARTAGVDMRRYYRIGVQTYMFILNGCRNVLLRDISVVHCAAVERPSSTTATASHVHGVYIYSDLEKGVNADGIDIVSSAERDHLRLGHRDRRRCDRAEDGSSRDGKPALANRRMSPSPTAY